MNTILKKLRKYDLYVNLVKYRFIIISIEFLDYVINNYNISINSNKVEAIKSWLISINLRKLQIFLEFVNFYKRFIVKYAKVLKLFLKLLKNNKNDKQIDNFIWSAKIAQTFIELIKIFIFASILIYFNLNDKILVETNISRFAIAIIIF